ncbi:MAG: YiiX/YebB-like N1pC/P60 family cysteine hydrolase [Anaerovoracaceae bacterium]|jgi:hypothetical protein
MTLAGTALPGDIVHVRSAGLYGWAIRTTLRSWGNHDGILVFHASHWYVAEALTSAGFVLTPWSEYQARIHRARSAVCLFRHAGLTDSARSTIRDSALYFAGIGLKYDWRAIAWIGLNLLLRTAHARNHEHRWYCTEAVRDIYRRVDADVWAKSLPTPGTTAKRQQQGLLTLVAQLTPGQWPRYQPT